MKWIPAILFFIVGQLYSAHANAQTVPTTLPKKITSPMRQSAQKTAQKTSQKTGQRTGPKAEKKRVAAPPSPVPAANTVSDTEQVPDDDSVPEEQKRPALETSSSVQVLYGSASWNKAPDKIDEASILMRDSSTGRVVQLRLFETAPDSSEFAGLYSISWHNLEKLQVEFYVPMQALMMKKTGMSQLIKMISNKELKRNAFILRRSARGLQSVNIFDTRDQAMAAMKIYKAEQQLLAVQTVQAQRPLALPSQQDLDAVKQAELLRQQMELVEAQADRVRIEQIEAQRIRELQARQAALKESEKAERRAQAALTAEEGQALFREEKFADARAKFDEAVALDPENRSFYYKYGVALYKTDDFNRSLVMLQMATGPDVNSVERQYFIALNHFRLRDYDAAIAAFDQVIEANDENMTPSARFYKGVVLFEKKSWEQAQAAFQAVLDTSKDPKLDERAESYLEQILRLRQYEEERKKKWLVSASIGEMYDQNVLLISDSQRDTGAASDAIGYRSMLAGGVRYRPVYDATREFAAQLDVMTIYTLDKTFKANQQLRNSDPTIVALNLPWTYKGTVWGKGYKFDASPGFETTYMSIDNNETKQILSSYVLALTNLFVMNEQWFAYYNIETRSDSSKLNASVGDDDASALKIRFINSNLIFLTSDKSRILTAEASATMNEAVGKNSIYQRLDLSAGYIRPWLWETTANVKLGYFRLTYPRNANERADNSLSLTAGLSRKIDDIWSAGFLLGYTMNSSNVVTNQYNKMTALLTLSTSLGF